MSDLLKLNPDEIAQYLKEKGISRVFFTYSEEKGRTIASHPELQSIADYLDKDCPDFKQHEGIFIQASRHANVLHSAHVHSTSRGQAQGGTRYWTYDTFENFLRDGIRLSLGMTRKNALAGLWWGGGKGVISRDRSIDYREPNLRKKLFEEYGKFVTSLNGAYVTAEDVGTEPDDIDAIFSQTRFVTCIPPFKGGSGNPSTATASGVIRGMEAALAFLGMGDLKNKTIAVQGVGHVGAELIRFLFESGVKKVTACDIDPELVAKVQDQFAKENFEVQSVNRTDLSILTQEVDIFAPCATGAILSANTIPKIRAKIVCGAANNQLAHPDRDDDLLHQKGIVYVPDFLVNRLGIVNCANEQYGYVDDDPFIQRHLDKEWEQSVYQMTLKVLERAKEKSIPPGHSAEQVADELALEKHPIFGHRGIQTIRSIVRANWIKGH